MKDKIDYLNAREAWYREESARLSSDDRRDEGDLAKIRANVCGICEAVLQTLPADKAQEKLDELYRLWGAAREKAVAHDDRQKAAVEEVKLETLDEICKWLGKGERENDRS